MYICICNQVNDRQIADAVRDGARSLDDLRCELDVATCCGKCADDARRVVENTLVAAAADTSLYYDATA
ncbi:MAG: (2Fe-2S)-binding protein [Pseudomonadales bacterium]|nr:(2Fe-2S)-binding protein [Pseudomonadales bacterium]